jgi:hypothetical protein
MAMFTLIQRTQEITAINELKVSHFHSLCLNRERISFISTNQISYKNYDKALQQHGLAAN